MSTTATADDLKPAQFDTSKQNLRRVAGQPWHKLEGDDVPLVIFATAKGFLGHAERNPKSPGQVKVGPVLI